MLEALKRLYTRSSVIRFLSWLLVVAVVSFLWYLSGLPPRSWFLLVQYSSAFSQHWQEQQLLAVSQFLLFLGASLIWLCVWGALLWCLWKLLVFHWQFSRQQRKQEKPPEEKPPKKEVPPRASFVPVPPRASTQLDDAEAEEKRPMQTHHTSLRRHQVQPIESNEADVPVKGRSSAVVTQRPESAVAIYEIPTKPARPVSLQAGTRPTFLRIASVRPLEVGVGWNTGITRMRSPNEDSLIALQSTCTYQDQLIPFALFVVADGMGGHENGREASRIAIQSMMHTVLQSVVMGKELSDNFLTEVLIDGVEWANNAILECALQWGCSMGTTLTAALIVGMKAYLVNVGDSRAYLFREGFGLRQITQDHSIVASLVALGEITPDEMYTHPERNKIYRSLGCEEHVDVDWFMLDLQEQDVLLLCSDGLWEMVRDNDIARILYRYDDPVAASDLLLRSALKGGGKDNISLIVARVP
ncbi:serine/threonine protein phosphatase PrpC [Thermosporothrix hazakensis]|jgi:serine/threonine protein phosphatase PrpC|uniref:Serine/threonine protein phosphatase PrpC n=2 Tax=Thermosporothrix TaxID=768650 RepID=A0A326U8F1_THEHA|nr:protein phosphatase 2C domain-containing protein [Thermosporothrix hazakensis]PZW29579.1 serine/threonine protein phosphatase PrpC [Thermosporothrix hazakensis]BBH85865.1 hypothetical protein KTC_06160 [Thermosporothrix sp. COM3]GCE45708.1 hypothetical protein KTH_05770 [Thermosporothrix hazakensis]